jgi:hypothetical protein
MTAATATATTPVDVIGGHAHNRLWGRSDARQETP